MGARPKHPGRTAAQRRVLDAIGCGNFSPFMSKATRETMLREGLIVEAGVKVMGGRFPVHIQEYDMPIPVHMAWCKAVAEDEAAAL